MNREPLGRHEARPPVLSDHAEVRRLASARVLDSGYRGRHERAVSDADC